MVDSLCPICVSGKSIKISDDHVLCLSCFIVYNVGYVPAEYTTDYFEQEYKSQYGRTYKEDFESIYNTSLLRIQKIKKLLDVHPQQTKLLDIGCALGFFCKACRDFGFRLIEGLEISEFAADYCVREFNIPVYTTEFEEFTPEKKYDVVTAWFVLEHFKDPYAMVNKIFNMLEEGGVFACTLPSYFGPLFFCKREEWIRLHPKDHRIDISPLSIRRLLKKIGFKKIQCFPSGYHPERCGPITQKYQKLYKKVSNFLCFSDTLFVLAKK